MFEPHPRLAPDNDAILWRYLGTPRFVSLLAHPAVELARHDMLRDRSRRASTEALQIRSRMSRFRSPW